MNIINKTINSHILISFQVFGGFKFGGRLVGKWWPCFFWTFFFFSSICTHAAAAGVASLNLTLKLVLRVNINIARAIQKIQRKCVEKITVTSCEQKGECVLA